MGRLLELDKDIPLLRTATEIAATKLREVIRSVRTSPLGPRGLSSTLRTLSRDLQNHSRSRIRTHFDHSIDMIELGLQLSVYQVCKEAMLNAVKHARASSIDVRIFTEDDTVRLSVEDDGIGFDSQAAYEDHFGLLIMKERVEASGGLLHIQSYEGSGTIIAARFQMG